ncbi:hypothetical protein DSM106972_001420 [Dulcicalothrix desertica PCC 7102]|uniref:FAD-binding domain-containing protein n=1 Tax=Dulcicalothrix desertica PCC 7102 TaxID=232991 RepID=A0A433VU65_9CYAN|nr:2-polyprenyl-6-methoxyphenol hydroxylase-like oxidoreductase [Dulcicalothrix desertica]RUT09647.1 hypothetical protein DSM106972_001420 [Dulcicalothrix desertica PCC 7102]TWH50844.1 hypothetical protein CAL7102_05190 [Dulcicalothrix desertica PCC 7102]
MRLQRVQVPEFRVLKNVDITFEKAFVPNIFPIGSQNGGGKSTLLQLIFVLLHCSKNPERHVFLQNMLYEFTINKDCVNRTVATIEIWTGVKVVKLKFLSYKDSALIQIIPNLEFVTSTLFKGLLVNTENQVSGVKLHCKNSALDKELTADLVVDASGRNSQLPKFLEEIGYQAPETTIINSFLGYSTCWYEVPDEFCASWKALLVAAKPPDSLRGGILYPVEANRWAITLAGMSKDYPPTDADSFLKFARSLRSPIIYDAIKNAKPISPVYGYRRTENCRRHYEKLSRLPDGIVAIGDAVCAFNPIYGQGMTTGAASALELSRCLKEQFKNSPCNVKGFTLKFQKQLAKILQTPWLMATGEDFRYETTEGGKADKITQLMQMYIDKILELSVSDSDISKRFAEVAHMIKTPNSLFALPVLYKVLRSSLKFRTLEAP